MTEDQLLQHLYQQPFLLAPMAGITDRPFRSFMRKMGCGIVTTELVSATGLKYSSEKTRKIMEFDNDQHPVGVQLFGDSAENIADGAKVVQDMGADFIDLNFGCPVPKVVKKGGGSAILKDLPRLESLLKTVKSAVEIPVTIKIRTGWDAQTRNAEQVVKIAYNEGMTWVAIHGRTRAAGYSGKADWDYISWVKSVSPLPVIGNGDIISAQLALERLETTGCDAVMIGRGCLKNPWIFGQCQELYRPGSLGGAESAGRFMHLFAQLRSYLEHCRDERLVLLQTKKLAAWYSAGYPGSAQFRKSIFQIKDPEQLYGYVGDFFSQCEHLPQPDTSAESFLMGGHG